jgi:hypothetical protein
MTALNLSAQRARPGAATQELKLKITRRRSRSVLREYLENRLVCLKGA